MKLCTEKGQQMIYARTDAVRGGVGHKQPKVRLWEKKRGKEGGKKILGERRKGWAECMGVWERRNRWWRGGGGSEGAKKLSVGGCG